MTLDHYYGTFAYFVMAAEVIFSVLLLFYVGREAALIKKQKKAYFKDPWNVYGVSKKYMCFLKLHLIKFY